MLGRVVNSVRKRLSSTLKVENRKNCWQNLIRTHNERHLKLMSDFERVQHKEVTDQRQLNPCVLRVNRIGNSATIEDIAYAFPNAVMITIEKCLKTNKCKNAFVGFDSEAESIRAFLDADHMEIKGIKVSVTFATIEFERKTITCSDSSVSNNQ